MDTEEIAQGCKRGDPAAQAALFRRFRPDVWRVVSRYVTDASRAEDLLHDTFLLAFTHIGQLRDDARLEAWLLRLARNVALLYLRRKRSDDTLSLDDAQSLLAEDSDAADAAPPSLDELLGLVEQLPEGYRNVFKLYVLDGLSHDEIARLLHISPTPLRPNCYGRAACCNAGCVPAAGRCCWCCSCWLRPVGKCIA